METPQSPLHPEVPALLAALNLRLVDVIKWNAYTCASIDDPGTKAAFVLKIGTDPRKAESLAYEVRIVSEFLPSIDQGLFDRLMLPEYVNDGVQGGLRWMLTRHITGRPLMYEWSELSFKPDQLGGRAIDPAVAAASVDVLRDLRQVDIATAPAFVRRFDFRAWLDGFRARAADLVSRGLLEESLVQGAETLFTAKAVGRYEGSMFTNGDFYPRNFILLSDGKVALVDWVGGIDPWEFVAMHAWLLMWGNAKWQVEYVARIKEHFPVDTDEMQVALLARSFDLLYQWRASPEDEYGVVRAQMQSYFRQCLSKEYVKAIFA